MKSSCLKGARVNDLRKLKIKYAQKKEGPLRQRQIDKIQSNLNNSEKTAHDREMRHGYCERPKRPILSQKEKEEKTMFLCFCHLFMTFSK